MDVASMISTGHETPVMAQGKTAEEFEKRLGAALIAGDGTIAIDNCEQALGGDFLCQVLTQPRVAIRILGQSKQAVVPTTVSVFATGNNLRVVGDSTRRTIVCSLDPQCERPELRRFEVNVLELIRRDRPRYVVAALTILRYVSLAELPEWALPEAPLGSFEAWSQWVRAAVIYCFGDPRAPSLADPCTTMERAQAQDPELERLASVIYHWMSAIGDRPATCSEVIEIATKQHNSSSFDQDRRRFVHDAFREALLAVAGSAGNIDSRRLGSWLGRHQDRIVNGTTIVLSTMASGNNRWQLMHVPGSGVGDGEPPTPLRPAA
jgi:putative DNA primase/helicase